MNIVQARAAILAALAAAVLPGLAGADQAIVSLPRLIAQSTHIVIGTCGEVQRPTGSRRVLITIDVEQPLRGTTPATIVVEASSQEREGPKCGAGIHKLLFLRQRAPAPIDGPAAQQGLTFEPVEQAAGVIDISRDGSIDTTLAIVRRALDARGPLHLAAFRDALLRSAIPAPRALVAALLDGSDATAVSDRALLVDMACGTAGSYVRAAQLWAVTRAGRLRVAAARRCLEEVVAQDADRTRRLSAVGALGDLGDSRSVPLLLAFVDPAPGTAPGAGAPSRDGDLTVASVLALGKIRDAAAVAGLGRLARAHPDLALHSTVVHALGLIGGAEAHRELTQIGASHPHPLVRDQALSTAARLDPAPARRMP